MTEAQISSAAFQQALLRSEKRRILVVIAFVIVITFLVAIRIFVYGSAMNPCSVFASILLVGYELVVMRVVDHALGKGTDLPTGLWAFSVILESSFPAVGIAFLASPRLEAAYRPLATPWVLAFFPLLILSVLRLSPRVCRLAGIAAMPTYMAAA